MERKELQGLELEKEEKHKLTEFTKQDYDYFCKRFINNRIIFEI